MRSWTQDDVSGMFHTVNFDVTLSLSPETETLGGEGLLHGIKLQRKCIYF